MVASQALTPGSIPSTSKTKTTKSCNKKKKERKTIKLKKKKVESTFYVLQTDPTTITATGKSERSGKTVNIEGVNLGNGTHSVVRPQLCMNREKQQIM